MQQIDRHGEGRRRRCFDLVVRSELQPPACRAYVVPVLERSRRTERVLQRNGTRRPPARLLREALHDQLFELTRNMNCGLLRWPLRRLRHVLDAEIDGGLAIEHAAPGEQEVTD